MLYLVMPLVLSVATKGSFHRKYGFGLGNWRQGLLITVVFLTVMLPAAFIDPGDVTLMTVPGYPVAGTATRWFGGTVHRLPLVPENDFFPDLDGIPADVLARTKMLVLCYPNSPTGKTATREFYKRVIDFAHRHRVVVVQDAAHIMLSYDDKPLWKSLVGNALRQDWSWQASGREYVRLFERTRAG
jgi:bifunctional pyridoxal-dependent enzyme with beta-cystathionase and maltose regulon repressor activities